MADTERTDAAEKAYAAAASGKESAPKRSADKPDSATQGAKAKPAPEPKPAKLEASRANEAAASDGAPATKAEPKNQPKPARKAVAVAAKPAPRYPANQTPTTPSSLISKLKDRKMANTTEKTTQEFTAAAETTVEGLAPPVQDLNEDVQGFVKNAFEKSQSMLTEAAEFNKANLEAIAQSGQILSAGLQAIGKAYVETAKSTFQNVQADVEELRAVKSPVEFVQLHSAMVRKHFDIAVENSAKSTEAVVKLASEAMKPISNRVTFVVERVKQAA